MEYVFTGIAVFVGVVAADLSVAGIAMLRAKKVYTQRIEQIQRMYSSEEEETPTRGGGYA